MADDRRLVDALLGRRGRRLDRARRHQRLSEPLPAAAHARARRRRIGHARVLDLGCGEGAYSRELARRGARVTGVDGSATLIDAARQRSAAAGLDIELSLPERQRARRASPTTRSTDRRVDGADERRGLRRRDPRGASRARAGRRALHEHHPSLLLGAGLRLGGGKGQKPRHFAVDRYFERIAWEDRIAPAFRDADAAPSSSARGLHEGRDRRRVRAAGVSGADGDRGRAAGIVAVRADDARAVLPVHALGEAALQAEACAIRRARWSCDAGFSRAPSLRRRTSARCRRRRSSRCRRARARRTESDR